MLRVETDVDHGSPYEAHVRKSDGTEVEVLVDSSFTVTAANTMQHPYPPGPRVRPAVRPGPRGRRGGPQPWVPNTRSPASPSPGRMKP